MLTLTNTEPQLDLRVYGVSPEYVVGIYGSIVILIWRKKVLRDGALLTRRAFVDLIREQGRRKVGFFTVLDAECELSADTGVRTELAELLRVNERQLGGAAVTFEGQGFRMTMVRSVITAINIISHSTFPNSVFGDIVTAADWTRKQLSASGVAIDAAQLVAAVNQLRVK